MAHNLYNTVDPGGIPNLSSTIGGPKHLDLNFGKSVRSINQSYNLSDKAEGITRLRLDARELTHSRLCLRPVVE